MHQTDDRYRDVEASNTMFPKNKNKKALENPMVKFLKASHMYFFECHKCKSKYSIVFCCENTDQEKNHNAVVYGVLKFHSRKF